MVDHFHSLLLLLVNICLIRNSVGLSCIECKPEDWKPDPEDCPRGTYTPPCGCHKECAKDIGEDCGGLWDLQGTCGDGLECADNNPIPENPPMSYPDDSNYLTPYPIHPGICAPIEEVPAPPCLDSDQECITNPSRPTCYLGFSYAQTSASDEYDGLCFVKVCVCHPKSAWFHYYRKFYFRCCSRKEDGESPVVVPAPTTKDPNSPPSNPVGFPPPVLNPPSRTT